MKKKILILTIILLGTGLGIYIWQTRATVVNDPSDTEIRQKFDCDRLTKDARTTDYYCGNPDAYRKGKPVPKDYLGI